MNSSLLFILITVQHEIDRIQQTDFIMAGLLSVLYIYVFILIQLETFALLAGSLGLFVILAMVMYFSKKIDWFNE